MTYTTAVNHLTTEVSQLADYVAKSRIAGAVGTGTGNAGITDSDGSSINFDLWIPNWNQLSKGDWDKIQAERRKKGVKLEKSGKCVSYISRNNKAWKTLRKQNKKFKRQIKALKRTDVGKDDDSCEEDDDNEPSDAGDAFGGRKKIRPRRKVD